MRLRARTRTVACSGLPGAAVCAGNIVHACARVRLATRRCFPARYSVAAEASKLHNSDAPLAPGATPDTTPTLMRRIHANVAGDAGDVEDSGIFAPVVRLFAKAARPAHPQLVIRFAFSAVSVSWRRVRGLAFLFLTELARAATGAQGRETLQAEGSLTLAGFFKGAGRETGTPWDTSLTGTNALRVSCRVETKADPSHFQEATSHSGIEAETAC